MRSVPGPRGPSGSSGPRDPTGTTTGVPPGPPAAPAATAGAAGDPGPPATRGTLGAALPRRAAGSPATESPDQWESCRMLVSSLRGLAPVPGSGAAAARRPPRPEAREPLAAARPGRPTCRSGERAPHPPPRKSAAAAPAGERPLPPPPPPPRTGPLPESEPDPAPRRTPLCSSAQRCRRALWAALRLAASLAALSRRPRNAMRAPTARLRSRHCHAVSSMGAKTARAGPGGCAGAASPRGAVGSAAAPARLAPPPAPHGGRRFLAEGPRGGRRGSALRHYRTAVPRVVWATVPQWNKGTAGRGG